MRHVLTPLALRLQECNRLAVGYHKSRVAAPVQPLRCYEAVWSVAKGVDLRGQDSIPTWFSRHASNVHGCCAREAQVTDNTPDKLVSHVP